MGLKRFLLSVAGLCLAFCLAAEEYFDVRQRVQDWINTTYTGETKEEALERLRRISRAAKDDEAKIADMKEAFPQAFRVVEKSLIVRKPLSWHVHSLALGYDIWDEETKTDRHVDIIKAHSDLSTLTTDTVRTDDKTKWGVEGYVGVDGKLSFPFKWAADIKGGGSLSFSHQSVSQQSKIWSRSQQQGLRREASTNNEKLSRSGIKNLHLSFAVTLTNNSGEEMIFMPGNATIPVYMGGTNVGKYAKPYNLSDPSAPIPISASPGTDILFRLELDTTTARELVAFMEKNAPTIDLRRGNFPVRTGKNRDVVATSSRWVKTIPVRLSLPIIFGEWNIREKHTFGGRAVTLREALQAIEQDLLKRNLTIFGWKGKRLDTLSSIPFEGFSPKDRERRYVALVEVGERVDPVFDQALLDEPLPQDGCTLWIVDLKKYTGVPPAVREAALKRVPSSPERNEPVWKPSGHQIVLYETEKDARAAIEYYKEAAERGDAFAQLQLGWAYYKIEEDDDFDLGKNYKKETYKWFRRAAEGGNAEAQYRIGICEFSRIRCSAEECLKWLEKAAAQGHRDAPHMLKALQKRKKK